MLGEEKAPLVFRKDWVEQVEEILNDKKCLAYAAKIPRVAPDLLDAKPEAYIPHFVSLGPYHHWTLEKKIAASSSAGDSYEFSELKMSTMETYKVQSAAKFWRNCGKRLDDIVEKIKGMREEIEEFYDWPIPKDGEYLENFALMMAIDSSILLGFLSSEFGSSNDDMGYLSMSQYFMKCDIVKLENQIPLFVLREVLNDVGHPNLYPRFQDSWRSNYTMELSPFNQFHKTDPKVSITFHIMFIELLQGTYCLPPNNESDQPHLLGCLHALLSPFLHMEVVDGQGGTPCQRMKHSLEVFVAAVFTVFGVRQPSREGRNDILNSYNAVKLKKGGIQFKSFFSRSDKIRFDKYSGTLYLPRITVSEMQTEVLLRNMLAFEFNEAACGSGARGDSVARYVGLMNCLIHTPEDVRLLRESQVILHEKMSDAKIAGMWSGMCHPILTTHLEHPQDLHNAFNEVLMRKYYMSIVKKGVALFLGILLLSSITFAGREWFSRKPHT